MHDQPTLTYDERLTLRHLVSDRRREQISADSLDMDAELERRVERICEKKPKPEPAPVETEYLAAALAAAADTVGLTLRETQVLGCVAMGLTNEETGARLLVSAGTVKMHLHNLFAKLGARDRTHAVVIVLNRFGRSAIERPGGVGVASPV